MFSKDPSTDNYQQTVTQFKSGLPPLPAFSPLLGFIQWYQQPLECPSATHNPAANPQGSSSSDPVIQQVVEDTLSHSAAADFSRLEYSTELSTWEDSFGEEMPTAPQNNDSCSSPCLKPTSAVFHFPPLHDVGAFHAHARVVEILAPAMQRGSSHSAEVIGTTADSENCDVPTTPSPSPNSVVDLEFLSFSSLFSQLDNAPLSPSWKLDFTLSSSWHLAAESAISVSPQAVRGSNLVRRPATRRKGLVDPKSPKISTRRSSYMSGSQTLFNLSQRRTSTTSGILRAMNSPVLKSHGYRVRFEEIE